VDGGIYADRSDYGQLNDTVTNDNLESGIYLYMSDSWNITRHTSYRNKNNIPSRYVNSVIKIKDSRFVNNTEHDLIPIRSPGENCLLDLSNVTGTGEKPIVSLNNSAYFIRNWNNNFSSLFLCEADYSVIDNVTLSNTDYKSNSIYIYDTDFSNFSNMDISKTLRGLYFQGSSDNRITNVSISNAAEEGVYIYNEASYNIFDNITIRNVEGDAFLISYYSRENTLINSIVENSSGYGIVLDTLDAGYNSSYIYNNFLNNTDNIFINNFEINFWNTTEQTGSRIYGNGIKIGGNYYANPSGTGFSETCTDSDRDGFCDLAYNITTNTSCVQGSTCGNNSDFLALSDEFPIYSCGDTITWDAVLYENLYCPGQNGLIIDADDIVLDCAGHTLWGDNTTGNDGIMSGNQNNITVKNCIIKHFDRSIELSVVTNSTIYNNTIDNYLGNSIYLSSVNDSNITANTVFSNVTGAVGAVTFSMTSTNNQFRDNYITGNDSVLLDIYGEANIIVNNTLLDYNGTSPQTVVALKGDYNYLQDNNFTSSGYIALQDNGNHNSIINNYIESRGNYAALDIYQTTNTTIRGNTAQSVGNQSITINEGTINLLENNIAESVSGDATSIKSSNYITIINQTSTSSDVGFYIQSSNNSIVIRTTY
jgi:hypothetical protein